MSRAPLSPLATASCAVYVLDTRASGVALHPKFTPCDWGNHQYAVEVWLRHALISTHWAGAVTKNPQAADLVYIDADWSRWCTAAVDLWQIALGGRSNRCGAFARNKSHVWQQANFTCFHGCRPLSYSRLQGLARGSV